MKISSQIRSFRIGCAQCQHGFTLIELMVSLLIGLVIVLGATQLFMVSRESFNQVEKLSAKQSALNFSIDEISRDIRRADFVDWDKGAQELSLAFSGLIESGPCDSEEVVNKIYSLKEIENVGWSLYLDVECEESDPSSQPLASGFVEDGLNASPISLLDGTVIPDEEASGLWELSLSLAPVTEDDDPAVIVFQVMNRMRALNPEVDEPEPGYDEEGNRLYPDSCYRGGEFDPNKGGCRI